MIESPPARFVQWKAVLHGAASGSSVPELDWVSVAYLPKNEPPTVTGIAIQNPGIRAQGLPNLGQSGQASAQLRPPRPDTFTSSFNQALNIAAASDSGSSSRSDSIPQGVVQKGYQTVLWTAEDANDDQLEPTAIAARTNPPGSC